MEPYTAPPGEAWRLGDGPFLFSGEPPVLWGEVEIESRSDEKLKVRRIPATRSTPDADTSAEVRVAARLAPRTRVRAPAWLELDESTPPGRYTMRIECGDQHVDAVVLVREHDAVLIEPGELRRAVTAGEQITERLVLANHGNVTHRIPARIPVFLEERAWTGRVLAETLRQSGEDEDHALYLNRVLGEFRRSVPDNLRLDFTQELTLAPGERREVEVAATVPRDLRKGRTYVGSTTIAGARLGVEVECVGTPASTRRRAR